MQSSNENEMANYENNLAYDEQYNDEEQQNEEMEIFDDDYLINLHRSLVEMKKIRQNAEKDASLMNCRIRCLKDEQKKTEKKIQATKKLRDKKEQDIINKQKAFQDKQLHKEYLAKQLEKQRKQNQQLKRANKEAILMKQRENQMKLEERMRDFKEEKKDIDALRNNLDIEDLANKKTQCDYIKNQHRRADEKRRARELERKLTIKEELERKIYEEQLRIENAEKEKQFLEHTENDIIQQLKQTTQQHEALVENYERMAQSASKNFP